MIDPIGATPSPLSNGRVDSDGATRVVRLEGARGAEPAVVAETSARETAKAMAAQPPVDLDRVQQIKRALQEGRYPLIPAKIADRLIAAQLRWAEKK